MKRAFTFIICALALSACNNHSKRVIIYSSGKVTLQDKNIVVEDGTTHQEQTNDFAGENVGLNISGPSGAHNVSLTDDGLYILNLKPDTLLASRQHIGAEHGSGTIKQERLGPIIDSLTRLVSGQPVASGEKNYFMPPFSATFITHEKNAKIFGPFNSIPGGMDLSAYPEVYKVYNIKDIRKTIANLSSMIK